MLINNVLIYFTGNILKLLEKYVGSSENNFNELEEIRLRANKPLILKFYKKEKVFEYIVSSEEILETLQYLCNNSIYSYQNQICGGYITIKGGHRVGISGSVVTENNKIININYISRVKF